MSETKFDATLQSWMERGATRLGPVAAKVDDEYARRVLELSVALLLARLGPYRLAVARALEENEKAARAAEDVARAEAEVKSSYGRLYATAQAAYYSARADQTQDDELLKRRLARGMSRTPSVFNKLGIDRMRSMMSTALRYAEGALGVDLPAVVEAQQAFDDLSAALDAADNQKARAVHTMQKLFQAREQAKSAYIAARQFVDGALSLDSDRSIAQLMPAISDMYMTRQGSSSELAVEETQDEAEVVTGDPVVGPVVVDDTAEA
ncbi:hypothetical protein FRC96_05190 [Lujinxingia vulgaris]|uniref:Uncharacterized protein n=1 Tax=Lujinxingia vulgaris TaxID=2600176 RepID=A0A5C6XDH6_9DELT|nr:hypothetical protein [Lujinxingia vulgaris]TXD40838.1 hypothetical protein FRC96_05190 [Lujinxingia vulgaris]